MSCPTRFKLKLLTKILAQICDGTMSIGRKLDAGNDISRLLPMRALSNGLPLLLFSFIGLQADTGQFGVAWHRFGGGGGGSSGGAFAVQATIGQAEAGQHAAGGFVLQAGYWNLLTVPSLVVSSEDGVAILDNRSMKFPLATLLANDHSLLGYSLSFVAADGFSALGGTLKVVGSWLVYQPPPGVAANDSFHYTLTDGLPGSQHIAIGTVRLNTTGIDDTGSAPNAVRIAAIGLDVEVAFIGVPYRKYQVQYSADLTPPYHWMEFSGDAIYTVPASGIFIHVDRHPADPFRLYRAVFLP